MMNHGALIRWTDAVCRYLPFSVSDVLYAIHIVLMIESGYSIFEDGGRAMSKIEA